MANADLQRRTPTRLGLPGLLVALATILLLSAPGATATVPLQHDERWLLDRTNELRHQEGAGTLLPMDQLTGRGRSWARQLSSEHRIRHSDLDTVRPRWTAVGENVGRSTGGIEDVWRRLLASPSHHHALVNPAYTHVGIGTVQGDDGYVYVVQVFWRG
jgi:uncharacterized protein YkwD